MSKAALIEQDDRIFQGEAKQLAFDIVDDAEAPIDISAFDLQWILEELHDAPADILSKTTAAGEITVENGPGAINDRAVVAIDADDTALLEPRVYHHSLWRVDMASKQLLAEGTLLLQRAAAVGEGT